MNDTKMDLGRLHDLMLKIKVSYPFTPEKYPAMKGLAFGQPITDFAVNHSCKHMAKTVGALATQCEAADHGGVMDREKLREAAAKMTINTLNLASVLEMSAEELVEAVGKELK